MAPAAASGTYRTEKLGGGHTHSLTHTHTRGYNNFLQIQVTALTDKRNIIVLLLLFTRPQVCDDGIKLQIFTLVTFYRQILATTPYILGHITAKSFLKKGISIYKWVYKAYITAYFPLTLPLIPKYFHIN